MTFANAYMSQVLLMKHLMRKSTAMRTLRITVACVLFLINTAAASDDLISTTASRTIVDNLSQRPHVSAEGRNLVSNPTFRNTRFWQLSGGARYDKATSHEVDGSGSVLLNRPVPGGSVLRSGLIPVNGGRQYTFSYFMKTQNGPTYAGAQISIHRPDGSFIRNLPSTRGSSSEDEVWQEFVWPVLVPHEASFVRVEAYKQENTEQNGVVWVDNLLFAEGLVFRKAPATKKSFSGGHVRIDALGNFEVLRDGQWTPFFPLAIHSSNHRDWSVYSRQGWNTIIWTSSANEVEKAKNAVSQFNPKGMMAGVMIAQYTLKNGWAYGDTEALGEHIQSIYTAGLQDHLLFYYWDNENHHKQWSVVSDIINTIRSTEKTITGSVQHPIYALQGSVNIARVHAYKGLVDTSGTYYNGASARDSSIPAIKQTIATPLILLDRLDGQTSPTALAQLNGVDRAGDFRLRAYNAIIAGAKGIGYWRDCIAADCQKAFPHVGAIDEKAWSADIPLLRAEIDLLLPIIRQPHWTDWKVDALPIGDVHVGTRDYNGRRVLFLVNQTSSTQQLTVELDFPQHSQTHVTDFFSGKSIPILNDNKIQIELIPIGVGSGTRVLIVD